MAPVASAVGSGDLAVALGCWGGVQLLGAPGCWHAGPL